MDQNTAATPSLKQLLLRGLRIAASTVALVELLRNDWIGGGWPAWHGLCSRRWSVVKAIRSHEPDHPDPSGIRVCEAPFEGNPAAICIVGCMAARSADASDRSRKTTSQRQPL